ncbi:hypothetical protein PPROV_000814800 [Pycnococcus provasolii]|uniref:Uncharacterized protein n=1 Tax=Pycnococcus provasolii TaxID=41880 RepID=A0A830HRV5_9CHLO|nr:hypothetical protein PPROV_000814800 [Pycnococcus provasolii]
MAPVKTRIQPQPRLVVVAGGRTPRRIVITGPPARLRLGSCRAAASESSSSSTGGGGGGGGDSDTGDGTSDGGGSTRASAALRAAAAYRAKKQQQQASSSTTTTKVTATATTEPPETKQEATTRRRSTGLPVSLGGAPPPEDDGDDNDDGSSSPFSSSSSSSSAASEIANRVAKDTRETKELGYKVESVTIESIDKDYKPKVSTWGVFERPADISKTFGGGRTIRPGQALESDEDKAAREKKFKEQLAKFRENAGLVVDDEQIAAYDEAFSEGDLYMDRGELEKAENKYFEASECMPYRSKKAGEALLRMALAMDSQGESRQAEAQSLYNRLRTHPNASVSKGARRMTEGFDAMTFLKADKIVYDAKHETYWKDYVLPSVVKDDAWFDPDKQGLLEEDEEDEVSKYLALAVLLAPLTFIAVLAAQRVSS